LSIASLRGTVEGRVDRVRGTLECVRRKVLSHGHVTADEKLHEELEIVLVRDLALPCFELVVVAGESDAVGRGRLGRRFVEPSVCRPASWSPFANSRHCRRFLRLSLLATSKIQDTRKTSGHDQRPSYVSRAAAVPQAVFKRCTTTSVRCSRGIFCLHFVSQTSWIEAGF